MFNNTVRLAVLSVVAATIFSSCDKEEVTQDKAATEQAELEQAVAYEQIALALAKTLGDNANARVFLKAEANKKFDGDYDVLYTACKKLWYKRKS